MLANRSRLIVISERRDSLALYSFIVLPAAVTVAAAHKYKKGHDIPGQHEKYSSFC